MSVLTTTRAPSSYQFRLTAFNGRKSPLVFLRIRVHKLGRQIRCFTGSRENGNGNVTEQGTNSNFSVDAFSGWSDDNNGSHELNDSPPKKGLSGGTVGAGIAGIILVAGLTFAAFYISKTAPKPKQKTEALTTHQEESLPFANQDDTVEEDESKEDDETLDERHLEGKTDVNPINTNTDNQELKNAINGSDKSSLSLESFSSSILNTSSEQVAPKVSANSNQQCPTHFANEQNDYYYYKDNNKSTPNFDSMDLGKFSFSAGIPAPSIVSPALQAFPGKVLVAAVIDQVHGQALAALQVLKVVEGDVKPGDICTRREYARWLVSASSSLSRNTISKVYPAMYIENVTELAFDDITPEDPDFASIQGLAEAGLIASKLSRHDMNPSEQTESSLCFCPESPLSRQDLVSWKMSLEKRLLPVADRTILQQCSGFIDIDKINPDAWPALIADLSAGDQGIIGLAFGYTRLFQPGKPVTKAQAAMALATGEASYVVSEELARIEAEAIAEKAVAAHTALVEQVENDINANFEKGFLMEKEKINAVEKMAEEAKQELERLKVEREEENIRLMKERADVDSEMEVFSRLRHEVEEQLQSIMSNKVEILYEKERLDKLRIDVETENQEIARLQHELEAERKALSMARSWAEDEAKRAREQAKVLEEARDRWESRGIKVIVDKDLHEEANAGVTWLSVGNQFSVKETKTRAASLVEKLKPIATDLKGKSRQIVDKIINKILVLISQLKEIVERLKQKLKT